MSRPGRTVQIPNRIEFIGWMEETAAPVNVVFKNTLALTQRLSKKSRF